MIRITETMVVDDREIKERFVRASGPGGQNVRDRRDVSRVSEQ
jgi:protein subunit release factor B